MSQSNGDNKKPKDWSAIIGVIVVVVFLVLGYLSSNSEGRDVTHDPNGFMGYSDGFWEWLNKQ